MKMINFRGGVADFEAIAEAGIVMTCDSYMNLLISDEDYLRLEKEFPAAFEDSYIVERYSIGQRIAQIRKEHGMTQKQLAEAAGMNQPNIARIEAGQYTPSINTLERIVKALGKRIEIV